MKNNYQKKWFKISYANFSYCAFHIIEHRWWSLKVRKSFMGHPSSSSHHPWQIIILLLTGSSGTENNMLSVFARAGWTPSVLSPVSLFHTTFDGILEYWQRQEFIILNFCSTNPFMFWTLKNKCIPWYL